MDLSRRSFKAYSIAQPIKKQIDETLIKVEMQKRKFLTLEREEINLNNIYQRKKQDLIKLRQNETETKANLTKAGQSNTLSQNIQRKYLTTFDEINKAKAQIDVHRKQISKFKQLNNTLKQDIEKINKKYIKTNQRNILTQQKIEEIKDQILKFRQLNFKNLEQFRSSHTNLHKSNINETNQRKKKSMNQKQFLGQQYKNSKLINQDSVSQMLRSSGIRFMDQNTEIMTQSVPLAKQRIKRLIQKNRQKLRIAQNYKKFGQNLQQMFGVMKQYKGRDDLTFIAEQFVTKQKQLQKIEQYIGQLQNKIRKAQITANNRKIQETQLQDLIKDKNQNDDEHYKVIQQQITRQIKREKQKQKQFLSWFQKISNILLPLTQENLTRSSAPSLIGQIEASLNLKKQQIEKKNPPKNMPLPSIDLHQNKHIYNQLMNYQKMRQYAYQYVKSKK